MTLRLSEEEYVAFMKRRNKTPKFAAKTKDSKGVVTGYKSNVKGWRMLGGKRIYFRSLWEIQYAQTLEWYKKNRKIIDWWYEPKVFDFPKDKYRTGPFYYKPDFLVFTSKREHPIWYEVKGYMTKDSAKKIKRFKKHYPEEEIVIIEKSWFQSMRKNNMHKLIGWEQLHK